jgi:hypothetical protein
VELNIPRDVPDFPEPASRRGELFLPGSSKHSSTPGAAADGWELVAGFGDADTVFGDASTDTFSPSSASS